MNSDGLKFKLIYTRLLLILFVFVVAYSFLHWLFFIQWQAYDIREYIIVWVLPFVLPIVPVWIWWRKRVKLLNLKTSKDNLFFYFLLLVHLFIGGVTIAAQFFLISAAGELRTLNNPEEIAQYRQAKFYRIDQYYADKSQARLQGFSQVSGKNNRKLTYEIVIAVPLYSRNMESVKIRERIVEEEEGIVSPEEAHTGEPVKTGTIPDTARMQRLQAVQKLAQQLPAKPVPAAWVCLYYKTSLRNGITREEKNEAWDDFKVDCYADFKEKEFLEYTYFESPGNNDERDMFVEVVGGNAHGGAKLPYVLTPNTEPYSNRYAEELAIFCGVLIIGGVILWVMIQLRPFDEHRLQKFLDERDNVDMPAFRGYI